MLCFHVSFYYFSCTIIWASLVTQTVKNLPAMWETHAGSISWEDSLEKETATHASILAWRTPWKRNPEGYSPWSHKESYMTEQLTQTHTHYSLHSFESETIAWFVQNIIPSI